MIHDIEDIGLDELEKRLRDQWVDNAPPRSALAQEDQAIAEKLLGAWNAKRLAATPAGGRFRPRKLKWAAEFIEAPSGWTIFVLLNGKRRSQVVGLTRDRLDRIVDRIQAAGWPCRPVVGEDNRVMLGKRSLAAPGYSRRPLATPSRAASPSKRREILMQIGRMSH